MPVFTVQLITSMQKTELETAFIEVFGYLEHDKLINLS